MLNSPVPNDQETFGQELTLDLYDCDLATISSGEKIKEFVIELCDKVIKMKRYGEPLIPHFGHENPITSGYSLVQLIETSNVSAHFSEYKKAVYLNIFSCAWFDPIKAEDYCRKFFGAKSCTSHLQKRI
ncbi:MAG: S-adenosylmethionine decarboxylase [Candidatus Amesbacteria bacterium]|nr:S-adenosylmethionine decarboxylase [Candidatus Amesbacteria bacterium]